LQKHSLSSEKSRQNHDADVAEQRLVKSPSNFTETRVSLSAQTFHRTITTGTWLIYAMVSNKRRARELDATVSQHLLLRTSKQLLNDFQ